MTGGDRPEERLGKVMADATSRRRIDWGCNQPHEASRSTVELLTIALPRQALFDSFLRTKCDLVEWDPVHLQCWNSAV